MKGFWLAEQPVKGSKIACSEKLQTIPFHSTMDEQQLLELWFQENKLTQYKDLLIENGYDELEVIAALTDSDLRELGVNLPGHRKKILMRTARLRKKFKLEEDDQARSAAVYSTEREQGLLFWLCFKFTLILERDYLGRLNLRAMTESIIFINYIDIIGLLIINKIAGNMSNCYNLRFRLQSQEADWEHSSTRNSSISVYGHQHFWGWALQGCIPKPTETVGGEALNIVSHNPSQK